MIFRQIISIALVLLFSSNIIFCEDYRGTLQWNESVDSHSISYIPNIQYLGQGYNIFTSNPYSTQGLDPGYNNIQAINLTYDDNLWRNVNPDRSYFVPEGVSLSVQKSCTMSFTAKEVTSLKQYTENLEASVSVKGSYFGGKFRASVDYSEVESGMSSGEMQYIVSKASCAVFDLGLLDTPTLHPLLSTEIQLDLKKLASIPNNNNNQESTAYYNFFDTWGTHVVTSLKLGSLFGYRFQMKKTDVQKMKNQGINVSASASYFNVRGRTNTETEQNNQNQFTSAIQSWTSYSIGATPDSNNDPAAWATQTLDKPMPIQSSITPYHEFLSTFTQRGAAYLVSSDITKLVYKLRLYSNKYCSERLLSQGRISRCKGDGNDTNFNENEQTKMNSYSDIGLLDISRNNIVSPFKNETNYQIQLQLQPVDGPLNSSKFRPKDVQEIKGGIFLGRYLIFIQGSQHLVASPTVGEPAKIIDSEFANDYDLFIFIAYDENVFSLRLKKDPTKSLGFDDQGVLRTQVTDSCFECQVFQIKRMD